MGYRELSRLALCKPSQSNAEAGGHKYMKKVKYHLKGMKPLRKKDKFKVATSKQMIELMKK